MANLLLILFMLVSYPLPTRLLVTQAFHHLGHVGVDITVKTGTPVLAILDGTVKWAVEDSKTYGRFVMIIHDVDGYASLYGHLSQLRVKAGDHVLAGQIIGLSGGAVGSDGAGVSTGEHLHFEIRQATHLDNNLYNVDPMAYLQAYFDLFGKSPYREYIPV